MIAALPDPAAMAFVLAGALVAGFTTGFAGFGTGLVASGLWFHALPAPMVPPLVALASVAAQLMGLVAIRRSFEWRRARPFLIGGVIGLPFGVLVLGLASPELLKLTVGAFLAVYAAGHLLGLARMNIGNWGGQPADGAIGVAGGWLGGFAGLSGALPLVWLQMRGGPSAQQRATYQPFNLIVLSLASLGMAATGSLDQEVATIALLCLPATLGGAWLGVRLYSAVDDTLFRRVVLLLLLVSGVFLVLQSAL
ncbi:MAG: sulfite exporter TauE/SafE family protein [Paracoccaceae bacterium]|nr:sulfite exporter TauE/SafE family protein [Paracoccaceae bacterium]